MSKLTLVSQKNVGKQKNVGIFSIEPLEPGQGITLGNALRRTLLTELYGAGITSLCINDAKNEFDSVYNIREEILELILNLKEVVFGISKNKFKEKDFNGVNGIIFNKGPKIITSSLFKLPKNSIKVINPSFYICTIINNSNLFLEVKIKIGKGYAYADFSENLSSHRKKIFFPIDTNFSPIKKVYYNVELIYNNVGLLKESLNIHLTTNGGVTPTRAICESVKKLINMLYPILVGIKGFSKRYKFYDKRKSF